MSVRRFSDALALLDWMLDAHERRPERKTAIIGHADYEAIATHHGVKRFEETLRIAERAGAVRIEYSRKPLTRHEIARVRLHDADALYQHLSRERASETAAKAAEGLEDLVADRPEIVARIPGELEAGWAQRKTPYGLTVGDIDLARDLLKLLCGFLDGLHQDSDQRSFARRATGDSKALERRGQAGRVAKVLSELYDLEPGEPREVLDALGIRKFPSPICLSGPVAVVAEEGRTIDLSAMRPYAALAPDQAAAIRPAVAPPYVMTVENFASFNRQVREITDGGLIVYTGGFPSRSVQAAIQRLEAELPDSVPFFHWGDIDPWGLRIFRHIETLLARPLTPHLMDRSVAADSARAAGNAQMRWLADSASAIADLAEFLASPDARHMEQEELDPVSPKVGGPIRT